MGQSASRTRILIVGGVAGGASCAARARRLDDDAEIIMFERGPHVSFANCGLPYHVGGVIPETESLLLTSPETFRDRFGIDVKVHTEVVRVDRAQKQVFTRNRQTGEARTWGYDSLVLATGARPIMPPSPAWTCPASSPSARCRTPPTSARGSTSATPAGPWWWAAASSAWRSPRTCTTAGWRCT